MAKRSDNQLQTEEKYVALMEKYKEAYKARTDFVSKFKLDPKKTKGAYPGTAVAATQENKGSAEQATGATSGTPGATGGSEMGRKIAAEAEKFIGKCVYRWGGKDPTTGGADCSGFTWYIYKTHAGIDIGGSTTPQAKAGTLLEPKEKALPGDLIMFQNTYRAGPSHVGIVYQWPRFIHCGGAEGRDGVMWGSMEDDKEKAAYWKTKFLSIRRIISDNGNASGGEQKKEEAKPKSLALSDSPSKLNEPTTPIYWDDNDGIDPLLLQGKGLTSTPGAPDGYYSWPIHWNEASFHLEPIKINTTASRIFISKESRANFLYKRISWGHQTEFQKFVKLNPDNFIHIARHDGYEGNRYSPDAAIAFEMFRLKCKRQKLEILSGFRFSPQGLLSPHEAGCAIDIKVTGVEDARKLADVAWQCGFRAIAIGGDIEGGNGFLHLDIGPKSEWGYDDIPVYNGPGGWM